MSPTKLQRIYAGLKSILLTAAAFAALASCAANPVTGKSNLVVISESQEIAYGRSGDQDIKKQYGLYDLKGLQSYVEAVGQKLARASHPGWR